jgi:hypothetical protein
MYTNADTHAVEYTYGYPDDNTYNYAHTYDYSDTDYSHANSNGYCYLQGYAAASPNASSTAESLAVRRRSPACFANALRTTRSTLGWIGFS